MNLLTEAARYLKTNFIINVAERRGIYPTLSSAEAEREGGLKNRNYPSVPFFALKIILFYLLETVKKPE